MSARLSLGKFLSSPVCRIYGDRDIPEAVAETLQSGLGQVESQVLLLRKGRFADKVHLMLEATPPILVDT